MFERLKRLLSSSPPTVVRGDFDDQVLGRVVWSEPEDSWTASVPMNPSVTIFVDGYPDPDPHALARARELVSDYASFEQTVSEALESELSRFHERFYPEIRRLRVESVALASGNRARGMIFLVGGDDFRVWRFDYVDGTPRSLGFDS